MTRNILQVGYASPTHGSDVQHTLALALAALGMNAQHLALLGARAAAPPHFGLGLRAADLKGLRRLRMRAALRAFLNAHPPGTLIAHRYRVADLLVASGARPQAAFLLVHGCGVLARRGRRRRVQHLLHAGWRLLAVSEAVRADLLAGGLSPQSVTVVPNALDIVDCEARLLGRDTARQGLGLAQDVSVVGAVGRMIPKKGFDLLIDAAQHAGGAWQLALIGDGRERAALEARARACAPGVVHFLGARPDAVRHMPAFDLLCVPSRDEGFGLVALEAMIARVVLLVSNAGGLPEVVGDTAPVVTPATPAAWALAIQAQLARPARERLAQAQAQRARASTHFGVDRYAERWARVLGVERSSTA